MTKKLLAISAMLLATNIAFADETQAKKSGFYIGTKYSVVDTIFASGISTTTASGEVIEYPAGSARNQGGNISNFEHVKFSAGYNFKPVYGNNIRTELEFSRIKPAAITPDSGNGNQTYNAEATLNRLMLNGYLDLDFNLGNSSNSYNDAHYQQSHRHNNGLGLGDVLFLLFCRPYLTAGVGTALAQSNIVAINNATYVPSQRQTFNTTGNNPIFAWNAGVGFLINRGGLIEVDVSYKYNGFSEINTTNGSDKTNAKLSMLDFNIGLNVNF